MTKPQERQQALKDSLEQRVLVLDGAMGTMIHQAPLSIETDYLGRENCPEILNVTRPDVIQDIHRQYLEAGADIIETNTFGGTRIALADNKLEDRAYELNFAAAKLAREIADQFSTAAKPRFVAGSIGPTNKDLNITGTTTFAELRADYYLQAKGLVEGGADYLLIETCFDTGSLKAGLVAVEQLERDLGIDIPVVACVTIERTGTMLGGQPIDALYASIANHRPARRRHELRHRPGPDDRPHPDAQRDVGPPHLLLSECRPAERRRQIRRDARIARRATRELRQSRLAEFRRRMLRHHARAHPRHRADGPGQASARRCRRARIAPTIRASNWSRPRRATGR